MHPHMHMPHPQLVAVPPTPTSGSKLAKGPNVKAEAVSQQPQDNVQVRKIAHCMRLPARLTMHIVMQGIVDFARILGLRLTPMNVSQQCSSFGELNTAAHILLCFMYLFGG